tara:strand:+ start:375 stop:884 length:510 start_codon:yes stop_codon:yes gene_type:complete
MSLSDHDLVLFYVSWMTSEKARVTGAIDMYINRMFENVSRVDHDDEKAFVVGLTSAGETESITFFNKMPTHGSLVLWIQNLEQRIKNTLSTNVKHCLQRRPAVSNIAKKWLRKNSLGGNGHGEPKKFHSSPSTPLPSFGEGSALPVQNSHVNEHINTLMKRRQTKIGEF